MNPGSTLCCVALALLLPAVSALEPTHRDVPYASDHPSQRLDVYLPQSGEPTPVVVFIHGGGWRAGSKNGIPGFLARAVQEGWLAVVSVEYRFTDVAPHPAQAQDCQRAVQFVRSKAGDWHLDPARVGITGGSAGAHLSLWVGTHDDAARPASTDPVERLSSRVSCVVDFAGPADWTLLSTLEHRHPGYRQLIGYEPGTPANQLAADRIADVSPVTFASADDPPMLLVHGDADDIVPVQHAERMEASLKSVGVPVEFLRLPGANHAVAGAGDPEAARRSTAFFREHFKIGAAPDRGAPAR